jgi:hypothetical protein
MTPRRTRADKSTGQRISNRGRERGLSRDDAFTAYVMDRLLHRLGRSRHRTEFFLKGGLLVANLVQAPHRFTRDIDMLRRHGRASPDDLRVLFREIVAVEASDGVVFGAEGVRAVATVRDEDGYDGVKVFVRATVGNHEVDVRIDIGFGDAVVPPVTRRALSPFLEGDESARVLAYEPEPVIAEKVETLVSGFPAVLHRLKDILDVVALADTHAFDGARLGSSLGATFERRQTRLDVQVIDDMHGIAGERAWRTAWATMLREKAAARPIDLREAVDRFDVFVRPVLESMRAEGPPPGRWEPGGPWRR